MLSKLLRPVARAVPLLLAAALATLNGQPTFPGETEAERDARMQWWRDAKYGMFIHWGASSLLGGEWKGRAHGDACFLFVNAKIPVREYADALAPFNPVAFDAEEWVLTAKRAGMRYIVFIAKHHDGFAMWNTDVSPFNIVDHTPFKRDVVAELAEACAKHDMKLGFYYSQARDWYHPGGALGLHNRPAWDEAQKGDFAAYFRSIAIPQVRELLTRYGPVATLWWDTPDQMTPELADEMNELMRLQPGIITNSRLLDRDGTGGDFATPERYIPGRRPGARDMEVCDTIGFRWIHTRNDRNWKSPEDLVRNLLTIVGKGGNFLLNVSPDETGVIYPANKTPILEIGRWLEKHGEAVYGTQESPFRYWEAGTATLRDDKVYLHVLDWPTDRRLVIPVSNRPRAVYPLGNDKSPLKLTPTAQGIEVEIPDRPLDPLVSVLVMELNEPVAAIRQGIAPDATGTTRLPVTKGERHGLRLRLVGDVIPSWPVSNYYVTWPVFIETAGAYTVRVTYGCDQAGGTGLLDFGGREVAFTTESTGSVQDFRTFDVGTVTFDQPGSVELKLTLPTRKSANAVQIKEVSIVPATH